MNKELADNAAKIILETLIDHRLNEAEAVYALLVSATMRLALDSKDIPELESKVKRAGQLFSSYLPANLEAFKLAIEAKKEALE